MWLVWVGFDFWGLECILIHDLDFRGSPFLKKWIEFLEEEADLRYPNVADLQAT